MARPKVSDVVTAEEADWAWFTPEMYEMVQEVAAQAATHYSNLNVDDLIQELCLYLGSRPKVRGNVSYVRQRLFRHCQGLARKERLHNHRSPSLEAMQDRRD